MKWLFGKDANQERTKKDLMKQKEGDLMKQKEALRKELTKEQLQGKLNAAEELLVINEKE